MVCFDSGIYTISTIILMNKCTKLNSNIKFSYFYILQIKLCDVGTQKHKLYKNLHTFTEYFVYNIN